MASSADIRKKISTNRMQIEDYNGQLEELKPSMFDELSAKTGEWIATELKQTVAKNPSQFSRLDDDQIKTMKAKASALITDFRIWHTENRVLPERATEDFIDQAFRSMASKLGRVLADYSFLDLRSDDSDWTMEGGTMSYKSGPRMKDLKNSQIEQYRTVQRLKSHSEVQLAELNKALQIALAQERFDSL